MVVVEDKGQLCVRLCVSLSEWTLLHYYSLLQYCSSVTDRSICYGGCGSYLKMAFHFCLSHFPFFQNEFHFSLVMLSD